MSDELEQITQSARQKAEETIDAALGEMHAAAHAIGEKLGIPEGVAGHTIGELLGRMSYVPSQSRDLRRACGQAMAKGFIDDVMHGRAKPTPAPAPVKKPDIPAAAKIDGQVPVGMDLSDLPGIAVQTVKALKDANLHTVGDVAGVPDEHLLKIGGIADKSLAQLRGAIAKAST